MSSPKRAQHRRPRARLQVEALEQRAVPTASGLHPHFRRPGEVVFSFHGASMGSNAVADMPGGGVVVAGSDVDGNLLVASLRRDGSFDPWFGQNGRVVLPLGCNSGVGAVATEPDGDITIVAAGPAVFTEDAFIPPNLKIIQLNRDGSLETGFNGGSYELPGGFLALSGLAVSPAGQAYVGYVNFNGQPEILRLTQAGVPDVTFDSDGIAPVPFFNGFFAGMGNGVALAPGGKVVMVGTAPDQDFVFGFAAARLNADGSPDTQFGPNGSGTVVFGSGSGADFATSVAVRPGGRIVIAGGALDPETSGMALAVAMLDRHGSLVSHFGNNGIKLIPVPHGVAPAPISVALAPGGDIVVSASTQQSSPDPVFPGGFQVVRLQRNGALDLGFADQGMLFVAPSELNTASPTFNTAAASGVVVHGDGTITVAGSAAFWDAEAFMLLDLSFFITWYRD
jgi:uncharacterized delta-60 repeat protein